MDIYGDTHGKAQTKTMTRRPRSAKYTTGAICRRKRYREL